MGADNGGPVFFSISWPGGGVTTPTLQLAWGGGAGEPFLKLSRGMQAESRTPSSHPAREEGLRCGGREPHRHQEREFRTAHPLLLGAAEAGRVASRNRSKGVTVESPPLGGSVLRDLWFILHPAKPPLPGTGSPSMCSETRGYPGLLGCHQWMGSSLLPRKGGLFL